METSTMKFSKSMRLKHDPGEYFFEVEERMPNELVFKSLYDKADWLEQTTKFALDAMHIQTAHTFDMCLNAQRTLDELKKKIARRDNGKGFIDLRDQIKSDQPEASEINSIIYYSLEEAIDILDAGINTLQSNEKNTKKQLNSIRDLIDKMKKLEGQERLNLRLALRNQLCRLIKKIKVFTGQYSIVIFFQSGMRRGINLNISKITMDAYPLSKEFIKKK